VTILGVPMQDLILDPAKLLTAALSGQTISSVVVIDIATVPQSAAAAADPEQRSAAAARVNRDRSIVVA
jgi:hypothetical protein